MSSNLNRHKGKETDTFSKLTPGKMKVFPKERMNNLRDEKEGGGRLEGKHKKKIVP